MDIKIFKSSMETKSFKEIFNRYKTLKKILPKKKLTIFDVGANEGQTILEVSKNFPKSSIHAFEPLEECQNKLIFLKKKLKSLNIYLNFIAVGNNNKKKLFYKNISSNLSSFHKMNIKSKLLIKMKQWSQQKKYLKNINIPLKVNQITLSSYIKKKRINNIDILKIDTQGYEEQVLKGIYSNYLKKIKTIVVEINIWDFYKKNTSFNDVEKIIGKYFQLWDIAYLYKNPKYHSTDYVDAIYINKLYLKKII